ncbi:hypothetical protein Scani_48030 [Streptomyces caniferus]|uniref:Uncharacterized protein n=1 Tax=Streptomyces caniferus TaxID=285557 RepID=A0A640SG17_9ACTN|nr:hypothetical protein Scani_48030 [Streptomyces caniferus]
MRRAGRTAMGPEGLECPASLTVGATVLSVGAAVTGAGATGRPGRAGDDVRGPRIRLVRRRGLVRRRKSDSALRGNHRNLLYVGIHVLRKRTVNFAHEVPTRESRLFTDGRPRTLLRR